MNTSTHPARPIRLIALPALLLLSLTTASAAPAEPSLPDIAPDRPAGITYSDAVILGIVEGLTEYLPVSSTGHLILANRFLGLDSDQPLGEEPPGETEPKTLRDAANAYTIIIQGGAILAVVLLYWRRILDIAAGVFGRSRTGFLLFRNLVVAFLPAACIGLLLEDWIDRHLFGPLPVINSLVLGGILMLAVEHWRRKRKGPEVFSEGPDLHELSVRGSLLIGFLQCVAMWPGTSRSMMTIVGGYLAGFSPARAAEFSFLLGLITLSAASGYKAVSEGGWMFGALDMGPVIVGILVATIFAMLSVKWLVSYLTRHGLGLFAWYRILLALAVVNLLYA
ncbi:MAG: undecaprenyl-diphosphate phosphatase [Puniceicoccaceae bacterium]